ncbi:MAG TPA: response regulator [Anaerolineae bacterium]|nr:response regulator [Anaerolineae bacterium]HQI86439.1 response regulator [Anaerolineae bacterium]
MQTKRVLIVDDDPAVVLTLSASLERLGDAYAVDTCANGLDALQTIKLQSYDLLITDYSMPGMNGLDLAKAAQSITPTIHVILMTAYGTRELREEAAGVKSLTFVDKPFTVKQIRDIVTNAMQTEAASPRVLIIEDNLDLRRLYNRALARAGYDVTATGMLAEAHALLDQSCFDVLLCDIHIGAEKGTDLIRAKRAQLQKNKTHVVMITGETWYGDIAEEVGADLFLEKPVGLDTLVGLVGRLTASHDS